MEGEGTAHYASLEQVQEQGEQYLDQVVDRQGWRHRMRCLKACPARHCRAQRVEQHPVAPSLAGEAARLGKDRPLPLVLLFPLVAQAVEAVEEGLVPQVQAQAGGWALQGDPSLVGHMADAWVRALACRCIRKAG